MPEQGEVLIIGAGPVGLFLGLALGRKGIHCTVIDRRLDWAEETRAIGIHPPSMALFDRLGIGNAIRTHGRSITKGVALVGKRELGVMRFNADSGSGIVTLPQYKTEALLREAMKDTSTRIISGMTPSHMEERDGAVHVQCRGHDGAERRWFVNYAVGCDGHDSWVRERMGVAFQGSDYPDRYIMGDFPDHLQAAETAYIYLSSDGLVEAIPLPEGRRRWVLRLESDIDSSNHHTFRALIHERTGEDPIAANGTPRLSAFGIQRYVAERVVSGRVILAGDAAHVMSPIGGQGMNAGWLDAWDLLHVLSGHAAWTDYDRVVRRRAAMAIRRAPHNTLLGRPFVFPGLKSGFVGMMLNTPLRSIWQRRFTMQGLPRLAAA